MKDKGPIFSGKKTKYLWKAIERVRKKRKRRKIAAAANDALYYMGCLCQELEAKVEALQAEVARLKEGKKDE